MLKLTSSKKNLKKIEKQINLKDHKEHLKKLQQNPYSVGKNLHGIFKKYKVRSYRLPDGRRLFYIIKKKEIELLCVVPRDTGYNIRLKDLKKIILGVINKL